MLIIDLSKGKLARACGVVVIAMASLVMAGCGDIFGHEEFTKAVMNKTEADVTSSIGKPAAVDSTNPSRVIWTYNQVTYDIENQNKRDGKAQVIFVPGPDGKLKVAETKFER